jgi:hypothetical protein
VKKFADDVGAEAGEFFTPPEVVDRASDRARDAANRAEIEKLALAQELFCGAVRSEPKKKTSIGLIPQSWDLRSVNTVVTNFEYGLSLPP